MSHRHRFVSSDCSWICCLMEDLSSQESVSWVSTLCVGQLLSGACFEERQESWRKSLLEDVLAAGSSSKKSNAASLLPEKNSTWDWGKADLLMVLKNRILGSHSSLWFVCWSLHPPPPGRPRLCSHLHSLVSEGRLQVMVGSLLGRGGHFLCYSRTNEQMCTSTNSCSDSESQAGPKLMRGREASSSQAVFTQKTIRGQRRPVSMLRQHSDWLRGPAVHFQRLAWKSSCSLCLRVHCSNVWTLALCFKTTNQERRLDLWRVNQQEESKTTQEEVIVAICLPPPFCMKIISKKNFL